MVHLRKNVFEEFILPIQIHGEFSAYFGRKYNWKYVGLLVVKIPWDVFQLQVNLRPRYAEADGL